MLTFNYGVNPATTGSASCHGKKNAHKLRPRNRKESFPPEIIQAAETLGISPLKVMQELGRVKAQARKDAVRAVSVAKLAAKFNR